ncbi:uncharacterized protein N7483_009274 [Penicillium malachiteum]|uniref:uncharacterized protein n=1 Tax=Penicillium malachiteum TaxID=1324776 RepID=UPI002548C30F|nr:uncharacterized protein N7483_009274 [Penicillium malachiteum]KAJ5721340.1 hypothetical protein N7483_009274 [Penicillium malachiteum]
MRSLFFNTILCLLGLPVFANHASASIAPWEMTWSDSTYGYDGPWHAVIIKMGGNDTQLAMYPGGSWVSYVLLDTLCDNTTKIASYCYGDLAGLYNPDSSDNWDGSSISLAPDRNWESLQWGYTDAVGFEAYAYRALDSIDVDGTGTSASNLIAVEQGYLSYPGGIYPLEVGILALGTPDINMTFTRTDEVPINGTYVTSWLYEHDVTPSYSYGMHIGTPKFEIPGSLYLGGYDKNRVLGDVSIQPVNSGELPIELLDINIGVLDGGSVWDSSNITGLMAKSNTSLSSGENVAIDATNPYIYLPQSTCDAITSYLPVTYNANLGLYIWDTDNENYTKIITSPSYLGFRFVKDDVNTEEIVIKVPFALLNLTLSAPLVEVDTAYFPLMPTSGTSVLGRAFLQSTFYGVHWSEQYWFLSQAPGPDYNFIKDVISIEPTTTSITGTSSNWEDTWASYWTALPSSVASNNSQTNATNTASATASSSSTGLSTDAKIGIGAGCGFAALVIIILAAWFCIRRRQKAKKVHSLPPRYSSEPPLIYQGPPLEMGATGRRDTRHELGYEPSVEAYYGKQSSARTSAATDPRSSTRKSDGMMASSTTHFYELS